MANSGEQPTEKILVTPSTKKALLSLKEPGERFGDVVERIIKEKNEDDFVAHLLRVAKTGDFVKLESDDEYRTIRDEVVSSGPRNRKRGASVCEHPAG